MEHTDLYALQIMENLTQLCNERDEWITRIQGEYESLNDIITLFDSNG